MFQSVHTGMVSISILSVTRGGNGKWSRGLWAFFFAAVELRRHKLLDLFSILGIDFFRHLS